MSKTQHVSRFFAILATITALFFAVFGSGCASPESWARSTIQNYFYRFDGDYSDLSDLDGLTIDQMLEKLDMYCAHYTADEYSALLSSNAGQKLGIGVSYSAAEGGGVCLQSILGGSPAMLAGLKAGDKVITLAAGGETEQIRTKEDFSSFLNARAEGEKITFGLADGRSVKTEKCVYTASYASMYMNDCGYYFVYDGGERRTVTTEGIAELPAQTAYFRLNQFYGNAAEELHELIKIFNAAGGTDLVLDLRGNGGGYVNVMADIGGLFTSALQQTSVAFVSEYKNGRREPLNCTKYSDDVVPAGTNVYVMANEDTASASESLIGVLVSYNIADYSHIFLSDYGDRPPRSYGKGIMQSMFTNITTGETLKLTVAGVYWQNGKTIHGTGLTLSDGCVAAPAGDEIVDVGYDDELAPVIEAVLKSRE